MALHRSVLGVLKKFVNEISLCNHTKPFSTPFFFIYLFYCLFFQSQQCSPTSLISLNDQRMMFVFFLSLHKCSAFISLYRQSLVHLAVRGICFNRLRNQISVALQVFNICSFTFQDSQPYSRRQK